MIIYYIINLSILIHVTVVAAQDGANFNYFSVSKFRLVVPQLEKEERLLIDASVFGILSGGWQGGFV